MDDFSKVKKKKIENQIVSLNQFLPTLSDEAQTALHMRYWELMTIEEIARAMGKTWDVTDRLIESALKRLRDLLADGVDDSKAIAA
ncbi:MAG: hypothetical protein A2504_13020 [Bdellovibrionales bacterium RIFOXYD12_FULL_39_22]|nr:MAG: hypothetical protein A2385_00820 [Bdellovibrionales bacterium RIFOXYB1_FULL_39_21]OFZ43550.1 MAG: hypothetical protein A2485_12490 [Bdellovibrionales bacterium RIFOXYC12_FULL_39_17]OFZ44569.1 MAG: hypothetical protein A2404_10180 [Bdellovibrionales bacterium RIFOXYC1_FULL_39_130]OFZ71253.1 MAG: hypothetical protein A2451_12005 [Bdellovibrionales bacterium RIFOXYC2_FULL_39_8]OFZ76328.1 MAG: hypothetical protein A2560_06800 [Bdellovibrionales bacterium RIFOXYD1_FULL_39_84]OFZ94594.1 MAG: